MNIPAIGLGSAVVALAATVDEILAARSKLSPDSAKLHIAEASSASGHAGGIAAAIDRIAC